MENAPLLGRIAVHLKMIDMDQLAEATAEQGRSGVRLGDVFVDMGFLTPAQLTKLVAAQKQVVETHRAKRSTAASGSTAASVQAPPQESPAATQRPPVATQPPRTLEPSAPPTAPPAPVPRPAVAQPAPSAPRARPAASATPQSEGPKPVTRLEDLPTAGDADRQRLAALLSEAVGSGASDIHLHAGAAALARRGGCLGPLGAGALEPAEIERMVLSILGDEQRAMLAVRGELDLCHTLEGVGRFRANIYRQQRGLDGVFRYITAEPPTLESLGLPARLARFTNYHQGMVLVTGPTGCGKSSTLAALVNLINEERHEHILTIEDPIEYLHPSKRCLVNQRSVESHTKSFERALRAALREDPDVIVIGELRDLETVSLALSAAETGHFVLATLHTDNSIRTLNRMVGSFPADQQPQVRSMLSESLRAVISQRLLPRADGAGRVAALETLVITKAVANLIRENKTFQISSILQTGASQGMEMLDQSIRGHIDSGAITREEGLRHCEDPKVLAA